MVHSSNPKKRPGPHKDYPDDYAEAPPALGASGLSPASSICTSLLGGLRVSKGPKSTYTLWDYGLRSMN